MAVCWILNSEDPFLIGTVSGGSQNWAATFWGTYSTGHRFGGILQFFFFGKFPHNLWKLPFLNTPLHHAAIAESGDIIAQGGYFAMGGLFGDEGGRELSHAAVFERISWQTL